MYFYHDKTLITMKSSKHLITNLFFSTMILWACLPAITHAQTEYGAFTATGSGMPIHVVSDYQCLGVNPANLGWSTDKHRWHLGLAGVGMSVYSEPITKENISMFFKDEEFTYNEKVEAARRFTDGRIAADMGINGLGLSYQDPDVGGFAFSIRERGSFNMKLNATAAELLWLGFNSDYFDEKVIQQGIITAGISNDPKPVAELFMGSSFSSLWVREFNFGYGRKIIENVDFGIYGGLGVKYIQGFSWVDIFIDENRVHGFSSNSPVFQFEYPHPTPSAMTGKGLTPSGSGFGFDIGLSAQYRNMFRFGLSLNDIGSINWDGNVYEASFEAQISKIETGGLGNESIQDIFDAMVIEDDIFEWQGLSSKRSGLPTHIRTGVSYIGTSRLIAGAELMLPMHKVPGAQEDAIVGLGVQYNPIGGLFLSTGFQTGGNYSFHIPLGFSLQVTPGWEVGLATRDISILFRNVNPNLSVSFGFMRFSFTSHPNVANKE